MEKCNRTDCYFYTIDYFNFCRNVKDILICKIHNLYKIKNCPNNDEKDYKCKNIDYKKSDKEDKENNMIDHPKHYNTGKYEVIDVADDWGLDKDAYLFNAFKYIARAGKKDPSKELEDLKKAQWYLNRKISNLEKK